MLGTYRSGVSTGRPGRLEASLGMLTTMSYSACPDQRSAGHRRCEPRGPYCVLDAGDTTRGAAPVTTDATAPSTLEEPVAVFTDAGDPDPRRKLIFFIVAIGLFMASVDATIVATAIKPIGSSLHSTINWTAWTVTIYQLGQIIAMPVAGKISDQFGRKKVYLISAAVFTVTSLACGLSSSIGMLVAFRFIQALGGGAFMPSATGSSLDHFGRDRDKALGMFTSIFPIGGIVGPVFGGVITQEWSWRGSSSSTSRSESSSFSSG